jgi:Flp pilus assembly protein TadG
MPIRNRRNRSRGQTLVIFALGLVALLAMVGLVIDGGNAFVQQRRTQNAADAASEAGTTELARRAIGVPGTDAQWDSRVNQAIADSATYSEMAINGVPQYTDFDGNALGPVGTGSIPASASGVTVNGDRNFRTYLAGIVGLTNFTASASATSRTGFVKTILPGNLLPITFPLILEQCTTGGGSNRIVTPLYGSPGSHDWPYGPHNRLALPLCSNGPGNIGWIDWSPTAGGASELDASIRTPNSPAIDVPRWYYIPQTGGITSLDSAMDTWEGRDVNLPIFDVVPDDPLTTTIDESLLGTCDTTPTGAKTALTDCPTGHNGGAGSNQWYYLVALASFHLDHSFIQGNHHVECNDPALVSTATFDAANTGTGQLLDNCLIGFFNDAVVSGGEVTETAPSSNFQMRGVQLIK